MSTTTEDARSTETAPSRPRLLEYLDWKINPVLLRDLRLYAKGRLLPFLYLFALFCLVAVAVVYTLVSRWENDDGQTLLSIISVLLALACGAVIPNLIFERFRSELANRATELTLMSPLTPARMVTGKLLAAWCVSLVVLSIAAPMIATAYLLGGINLISVLYIIASLALAAAIMPCLQLFMATQKRGKGISRIIASLVFIGQIIAMSGYAALIHDAFIRGRYYSDVGWFGLVSTITCGVMVAQFLFFATISRLRSEAESRDAAPRISLAFAAYVGGVIAVFVLYSLELHTSSGSVVVSMQKIIAIAACFVSYAFCLGFLVVSHSNPLVPRNLDETWKGKPLRRLLLLPGLKSLSAYFILNTVVILAFALVGCFYWLEGAYSHAYKDDPDFFYEMGCASLAPFVAVAFGMNVYYYLILPFTKEKRNPSLLPLTIILSNVLLVIASYSIFPITRFMTDSEVGELILGLTPLGLLAGSLEYRHEASIVIKSGIAVLLVLLVGLLPMLIGRGAHRIGKKGKEADATG